MVDPELLDAAGAMGQDHERQDGRGTSSQDGNPDAARWLADLRGQLAQRPVAALPYADPDVAALTHHGDPDELLRAVALSKNTTIARLGQESDTTVAWPVDGLADTETLGALRRAGAKTVVLSSAALLLTKELTYTPTGRARVDAVGAPLEVLVADQALTDALTGDLTLPGRGRPGLPALPRRDRPDHARAPERRPDRAGRAAAPLGPAGGLGGRAARLRRPHALGPDGLAERPEPDPRSGRVRRCESDLPSVRGGRRAGLGPVGPDEGGGAMPRTV